MKYVFKQYKNRGNPYTFTYGLNSDEKRNKETKIVMER